MYVRMFPTSCEFSQEFIGFVRKAVGFYYASSFAMYVYVHNNKLLQQGSARPHLPGVSTFHSAIGESYHTPPVALKCT